MYCQIGISVICSIMYILFDVKHSFVLCLYRGLGIERIFTAFLKIYCDPGSLVLVLNTSAMEEVSDWCILYYYQ